MMDLQGEAVPPATVEAGSDGMWLSITDLKQLGMKQLRSQETLSTQRTRELFNLLGLMSLMTPDLLLLSYYKN